MKISKKKTLLWILVPLIALIVVGGAGVSWMLSGSSAAPLALKTGGSSSSGASAGDLNGQWTVVPGPVDQATTAGYRVEEKVAGGLLSDTATGRTSDVTGSVTVVGSRVTAAKFTVNMTTLKSDKSLRDTVLKTNAIQTAKFPTAAFTLTDPIRLPDTTPGKIYGVDAHGTLLLHGVSKSVTVALHYQQTNTGFVLLVDTPIVMADYAITPPNIAGVVSVQNHGTFELRESGEMKTQTVARLSRPLALKLVLTADFERARIPSEAATLARVLGRSSTGEHADLSRPGTRLTL